MQSLALRYYSIGRSVAAIVEKVAYNEGLAARAAIHDTPAARRARQRPSRGSARMKRRPRWASRTPPPCSQRAASAAVARAHEDVRATVELLAAGTSETHDAGERGRFERNLAWLAGAPCGRSALGRSRCRLHGEVEAVHAAHAERTFCTADIATLRWHPHDVCPWGGLPVHRRDGKGGLGQHQGAFSARRGAGRPEWEGKGRMANTRLSSELLM